MSRAFRLSSQGMVNGSGSYTLYVDDQPVLTNVRYADGYAYCLHAMTDDDTYAEDHTPVPKTGRELREIQKETQRYILNGPSASLG